MNVKHIYYQLQVAAAHFNANAIIHFGHACLSKVARLPVLYIFAHFTFDLNEFQRHFNDKFPNRNEDLLIFYSDEYCYELGMKMSIVWL